MLPPAVAAGVARILGEAPRVVRELTSPWAATTRSVLVSTGAWDAAAPPQFVVQWSVDPDRDDRAVDRGDRAADRGDRAADRHGRRAMGRRLRLGRDVARLAPGLPLPELLGGDADGPAPYIVWRFVPGVSGRDLLGNDADASLLGTAVGRAAREIAQIPTAGLRLPRTWGEADRLGTAARQWLERAGSSVDADTAARVRAVIERVPSAFAGVRPVFAHGDLAPVNVIIRAGEVGAVIDFERARLAHPLFDAAWWLWIVDYHHPARRVAAGGAFLSAAGVDQSEAALVCLDMLAVLQCLEMLAGTPSSRPAARREWADRVVHVLDRADGIGDGAMSD